MNEFILEACKLYVICTRVDIWKYIFPINVFVSCKYGLPFFFYSDASVDFFKLI